MSSVSPVTGLSGLQVYPAAGYTDTQIDAKLQQLQTKLDTTNATISTLQSSLTNYRTKDIEDLVNSTLKNTLEGEINQVVNSTSVQIQSLQTATQTALYTKADQTAIELLKSQLQTTAANLTQTLNTAQSTITGPVGP